MNLGAPILLSGGQPTLLTRVNGESKEEKSYRESLLQELIDRQPAILPLSEFFPGVESVFSMGREIPVDLGSAEGGFIDNLLVTNSGHLVVVETKLWRNSESIREVVAQTLQYCMSVSRLSAIQFEERLRSGDPKWRRLGQDETVAQCIRRCAAVESLPGPEDDFEEVFDRLRRSGEILLLIVADTVRTSAERLVHWMNTTVGSAPHRLGLVELSLFEVPDVGRLVIPKTLLRIREGSRHVVTIRVENRTTDQVTVTTTGSDEPPKKTSVDPPRPPLTEAGYRQLVHTKNLPDAANIADELLAGLKTSGLQCKPTPTEILYGTRVQDDFVSLVHLCAHWVYFLIPARAVRALGEERFVDCKRKINGVADFYPASDLDDPTKSNTLLPRYGILKDKVEAFVTATAEIADTIRAAMEEAA